MDEAGPPGPIEPPHTAGIAPASVEHIPLNCLSVRESLQPLQHHDSGNHGRRNGTPPSLLKQVSERGVRAESIPPSRMLDAKIESAGRRSSQNG